jgi:membrane-associated phospholipid phosphatase
MDFHPFVGGVLGLFRPKQAAFPSGHTMLAFATAACLAVYYPRCRYLCFGAATLVALERVLEVAHHVSDVVAAAGLGIIFSLWCAKLLEKWASGPDQGMLPAMPDEGKTSV